MSLRAPPPVSVQCVAGPVWRALWWCLPALALGVGALWLLLHAKVSPWLALACLVLFLATGLALLWFKRGNPVSVTLAWDGQQWWCQGVAVSPQVMLDAGAWLLLRLRPGTGAHSQANPAPVAAEQHAAPPRFPRWLSLAAGQAGPAMHLFRVAVYNPVFPTRSSTPAQHP
jgi:hypothetical protein